MKGVPRVRLVIRYIWVKFAHVNVHNVLTFDVTHWYLSVLSHGCRSNVLHVHITSNRILKLLSWSNSYVSILHVLPVVVVERVFERCDKKGSVLQLNFKSILYLDFWNVWYSITVCVYRNIKINHNGTI